MFDHAASRSSCFGESKQFKSRFHSFDIFGKITAKAVTGERIFNDVQRKKTIACFSEHQHGCSTQPSDCLRLWCDEAE